jgi:S1-C subfamily serine protease
MVNLSTEDKKNLLNLLLPLPILSTEKGREAVFVSADLEELRPQVDLSGPSAIVIPLLLNFLCSYGRLSYEQEALGRFLNTIRTYVGAEQKDFLDAIIAGYGLMTPVAKSPPKIDWVLPVKSEDVLEKIIGENTLRPIAFLQQGLDASRSVAYIEVSLDGGWSGTGFMISPNLLITNHHVISKEEEMANALFRFNYQLDSRGNPQAYKDYLAVQGGIFHANTELDYAIVEVTNSPGDEWGYLRLKPEIPMSNSRVNIIQHPNGLPKQISIQNNFVVFADGTKIQYITSTQPGSSGSPVFDDAWQVIGLHHAGGWLPEKEGGPLYFRNEGIAIQAILADLPNDIKDELTKVGNQ